MRDLSPAASRLFQMVLGDTAIATCARISSLDAAIDARTVLRSWCASVLHGHSELGLQVWECSTDHCWKQWHTTHTLCLTFAKIFLCISSFPHAYNAPLFKWLNCNNRCKMLGKSIAGWLSAPLWLFASENTCLHCCQRGLHCVLMWLFWHVLL